MFYMMFLVSESPPRDRDKTLPKAPRARGLSSSCQSNFLKSYHKFKRKSLSHFIFRISTKNQLKNLNQTSVSPLNLKFKILTKPSFRILIKIQLHNLNKSSAAKCLTNSRFKLSPKLQNLNLDQPLCSIGLSEIGAEGQKVQKSKLVTYFLL